MQTLIKFTGDVLHNHSDMHLNLFSLIKGDEWQRFECATTQQLQALFQRNTSVFAHLCEARNPLDGSEKELNI